MAADQKPRDASSHEKLEEERTILPEACNSNFSQMISDAAFLVPRTETKFLLFEAIKFVVISYSSHINLKHLS